MEGRAHFFVEPRDPALGYRVTKSSSFSSPGAKHRLTQFSVSPDRILETGSGGVTVALEGHIGTRELNALTIAILAYTTLILSGVIIGFACALDTAGSQAYTSSNPKLLSLYVQRVGVLIFSLLVPISIFLSFGERWLLLLGQEKHVAQLAGKALRSTAGCRCQRDCARMS